MKRNCIIDGKILKSYDEMYYVSEDGEVYSKYSKKFLKHSKDIDGYHRVDIHGKHIKVHRIVYETWIGEIGNNIVRHIDDNKDNNHVTNLAIGNQKDNIKDCMTNNHRVGNVFYITVLDKQCNKILTFCPSSEFIDYSCHSCVSGSVNKLFNKQWFKQRYDIIEFKKIKDLEQFLNLKGVTTKSDECSSVGWGLSPIEVHRTEM